MFGGAAVREKIIRGAGDLLRIILSLILIIALTVGVLRLLDILPSYIQGEAGVTKHYATVEEAESKLKMKILLPAYFPDYLSWPPSLIKVERRPVIKVSLSFLSRKGEDVALTIHQVLSDTKDIPREALLPAPILQEREVLIDGWEGRLTLVIGEDGRTWNRLSWRGDDRWLVILSRFPPADLLRMARSMGHRASPKGNR